MTSSPTAPKVLIADDDADISALVAIAVRRSGLDLVDKLGDGAAAWHSIRNLAPDIVVLDVSMPGMTGLDVCRLLRADDNLIGTRVLLLSAAVDDASRRAGLAAGADEYMIKPFSPRELMDRLARLAARPRATQPKVTQPKVIRPHAIRHEATPFGAAQ